MAYILEKIGNTYNLPKKYFTCDAKSDLDGISLVDVPIGSEAYCILEEESYILDSNKQWHKKKIGEDLTGQVQADLSQTDSTQADYVKGIIRKESLPEGYPYKEIGTILDGTFEFTNKNGVYAHQITDENFTYVDGNSYTVIWDGEAYQCVATTIGGALILGNLGIMGLPNDTGEPFLFLDEGNGQKAIGTNNTAATHTITVRGEVAYPIAPEFLPEGYPYKKKDKILPETVVQIETANEAVNNPFIVNFTAGSLYKVIWDGITYEVVAANIQDATAIGNAALANMGDDTGEPFVIASVDGKTILFAETAGSHTISIISETIHPMATEFLPDEYITETELASKGYITETELASKGYLTAIPKEYVTETELASKGYLTSYTETDPTVPAWAKAKTKPSYDFSELTVNDPEAAKATLAIEKGMILNKIQMLMPSSSDWLSVTYGNGKFVAIANNSNQSAYSEDGINWTSSTMPSSRLWESVIYGNEKFVAVAYDSNQAAYSEDGISWTSSTMPSSSDWQSVTCGNGKFVAIAINSNQAAYSEDGINWTQLTIPGSAVWKSVIYGNGKFVVVAYNSNQSAYSEDGINWTQTTMPSSSDWQSVTYGNGKFVVVAQNSNKSAYSEDGINWTQSTMPSSSVWKSVTYGNGKFVAVAYNSNQSAYSKDGINWINNLKYISQNGEDVTTDARSAIGIPSYSTANSGQFLRVIDGIPTWTEFLPTLTSPNGTKYKLTVSDDGTLSAVVVS